METPRVITNLDDLTLRQPKSSNRLKNASRVATLVVALAGIKTVKNELDYQYAISENPTPPTGFVLPGTPRPGNETQNTQPSINDQIKFLRAGSEISAKITNPTEDGVLVYPVVQGTNANGETYNVIIPDRTRFVAAAEDDAIITNARVVVNKAPEGTGLAKYAVSDCSDIVNPQKLDDQSDPSEVEGFCAVQLTPDTIKSIKVIK